MDRTLNRLVGVWAIHVKGVSKGIGQFIGIMPYNIAEKKESVVVNLEKTHLLKLANMPMPFGKYQGRVLMDLPEEYLLWFAKQGFPKGELGQLLAIMLELQVNGLEQVLTPLRKASEHSHKQRANNTAFSFKD